MNGSLLKVQSIQGVRAIRAKLREWIDSRTLHYYFKNKRCGSLDEFLAGNGGNYYYEWPRTLWRGRRLWCSVYGKAKIAGSPTNKILPIVILPNHKMPSDCGLPHQYRPPFGGWSRTMIDSEAVKAWLPRYEAIRPVAVLDTCFYFVFVRGALDFNYQHWMSDHLPRLWFYLQLKKYLPQLKLIVSREMPRYQIEALELLSIPVFDLVFIDQNQPVEVMNLYLPGFVSTCAAEVSKEFWDVLDVFSEIPLNEAASRAYPEYVWLSRGDAKDGENRVLVNEGEIINWIKSYGFQEVKASELSWREKIGTFRNAKVIVGPIGAGFQNINFCSRGTRIILLEPAHFRCAEWFDRFASRRGCSFFALSQAFNGNFRYWEKSPALGEAVFRGNFPWSYDLDLLKDQLTSLLPDIVQCPP